MDRRGFLSAAVGVPIALALGRLPRALAGGGGGGTVLVLVTADLESHVVAVEASTGRVLRRIRTASGPRSIETVGHSGAVVAHTEVGAVSILDAASLSVRALLRDFAEPRYTAVAAGGRYAYVTDSGRGDVAVVDLLRGGVVARLGLDGPARHASLSPSGRRLWVALGSKAEHVSVIDVDGPRLRLRARLQPPFLAHDVGFTPDGASVWVTSGDRGTIAVYDSRRRRIRFRLEADAPPQHVTFFGSRAYVASGDDGTLRVHDVRDGQLMRRTRVPVGSYNVQQGLTMVATPSLERGTLCLLRANGHVVHETRVARSSHDACFVLS
ncbi:MAG: PQQ-binding-like beta-propeller repeat protein [Gaiellaceae bacterium]